MESAKDKEMQKGKHGFGDPVVQVLYLNSTSYSLIDLNKYYFILIFELKWWDNTSLADLQLHL